MQSSNFCNSVPLHLPTNCSSCLRFEMFLLQTVWFCSFHRCSVRFKWGLRRSLQSSPTICFSKFLDVLSLLFVLFLLEETETKLFDTGRHILLWNASMALRFHSIQYTLCARCSKAASDNPSSSMFHCRCHLLVCFMFGSVNRHLWLSFVGF